MDGNGWRRLRLFLQPGNAMLGAAVIVPVVLFALAAWQSYRVTVEAAENRVERTTRVLEEHALKVFETHRVVLEAVGSRLTALDWSNVDQNRSLHDFLKLIQGQLAQIAAITITDSEGRLRASSRTFPAEPTFDFADRDWFQALKRSKSDLPFISKAYKGRQSGVSVFNVADCTPPAAGGGFGGAVAISVDRGYFERFYKAVETTFDHSVVLVRDDGEILAAEPPARTRN